MCTTLFYYTCAYIYSLLNSCGYWTLNKYYCYYYYYEMLCLNFEIYNGVNVKQCNYLYNNDIMFVINPLYTY